MKLSDSEKSQFISGALAQARRLADENQCSVALMEGKRDDVLPYFFATLYPENYEAIARKVLTVIPKRAHAERMTVSEVISEIWEKR